MTILLCVKVVDARSITTSTVPQKLDLCEIAAPVFKGQVFTHANGRRYHVFTTYHNYAENPGCLTQYVLCEDITDLGKSSEKAPPSTATQGEPKEPWMGPGLINAILCQSLVRKEGNFHERHAPWPNTAGKDFRRKGIQRSTEVIPLPVKPRRSGRVSTVTPIPTPAKKKVLRTKKA